MKSFKRVFKYVWPQWPDIIIVVLSAMVIACFLSLSFVTVIPLLKIMMTTEGIHGWVDRKICDERYDISFDESDSFSQSDNSKFLIVKSVSNDDESPAKQAGLQEFDIIIGINELISDNPDEPIPRNRLLQELAQAPSDAEFILHVRKLTANNTETSELILNTGQRPFYLDNLTKVMSLVPREQTSENKTRAVIILMVGVTVITVIRCTAKYIQEYTTQKVVQTSINHIRDDTFAHALKMPVGFFANERPSDTTSRIIRDSNVMARALKTILGKALREPLNALAMVIAAMVINWQLTLIFLVGAPFILGLLVNFGRKMKKASKKSLIASSQMLSKLQEALAGLKVVKVYNRQKYEGDKFTIINNRLLKQSLKMSRIDAATSPVMEILGMLAGSAALIAGVYWINSGKLASPENFFALLILLGAAAASIRQTSDVWNKVQEANAAAERVFAVIDSPVEIETTNSIDLPNIKSQIEFRDIVFSYPGTTRPALNHINLTVKAGQNIALVGPNGSGKTTLANLVPRFYDPDSGSVLLDGTDIRQATISSLRDQIGMVTQNVVTFNDTIAANIAYGKLDATEKEITEAAKRAFAHEFIAPLPNGYQTVIGEDGAGLSGGQLQRIVIARAILKNPAILIFDEATSQVDADSEAKIHKALEEIMRNRTSFVIAHRFSTVIAADIIAVMDNGQIIAQGRHEQLIKTCRLYQTLYETQLVGA